MRWKHYENCYRQEKRFRIQHGDKAAEKAKELGVELVPRTTRKRRSTNSNSRNADAIDVDNEHGENPAENVKALGDDEAQQRVDAEISRATPTQVNQDKTPKTRSPMPAPVSSF